MLPPADTHNHFCLFQIEDLHWDSVFLCLDVFYCCYNHFYLCLQDSLEAPLDLQTSKCDQPVLCSQCVQCVVPVGCRSSHLFFQNTVKPLIYTSSNLINVLLLISVFALSPLFGCAHQFCHLKLIDFLFHLNTSPFIPLIHHFLHLLLLLSPFAAHHVTSSGSEECTPRCARLCKGPV